MLTDLRRQPERLQDPGRIHGIHRAVVRLYNRPPRLHRRVVPTSKSHPQIPLVLDPFIHDRNNGLPNFDVVSSFESRSDRRGEGGLGVRMSRRPRNRWSSIQRRYQLVDF